MNELTVTVTGWAASDPRLHVGPSGVTLTSFRLASTPRYFDRSKEVWVDGQTEWFSVRLFRGAAVLAEQSIKKGQPLIVQGRLRTDEWESDSGPRFGLQLDATVVGHDLTRGTATFTRAIGDPDLKGRDEESASTADAKEPETDTQEESEPALTAG